jgi:protein-tyrosine-phosphatase
MEQDQRAGIHRALGDIARLRIVDELSLSDSTPQELARLTGLETNLLAHHLGVLEDAALIRRRVSSGDRRRRYITLDMGLVRGILAKDKVTAGSVLFICTHNSARSQVAEAMFAARCDAVVQSAGPNPRPTLHPKAVQVAREMGVDLSGHRPKGYPDVRGKPDLVVSVCDRAVESSIPFDTRRLHWSIPDPVETDRIADFRSAFAQIDRRVDQLVGAIEEERYRR